jgi:hypothetical protein
MTISSMLERDARVCIHAFNLSFMLYYHLLYERGRSIKSMIPGPVLAIRKVSCYLHVLSFYFLHKNHKTHRLLILFCFVKLLVHNKHHN